MYDYKHIHMSMEDGVKLFKYDEGESVDPTFFKSLVKRLRYLTCTRPGILYVVRLVSRYMENLKTTHFKVTKKIFHYFKVTIDLDLFSSLFMTIILLDIPIVVGVET